MKIFSTIVATLLFNLNSASISGTGYGLTIDEAKKEALSDVLSNIGGMVSSSFSQVQILTAGNIEADSKKKIIKVDQNYPLLLPNFSEPEFDGTKYIINVSIDGNRSSQQYLNQLQKLETNIRIYIKDAENSKEDRLKIELYEKSLDLISEFEKYSTIARILNINKIPVLTISPSSIENEIAKISFQNDNFVKLNREEFSVEIKTDHQNNKFKIGERYEIFVKVSHKGYFYIVNHSITDNGESYSYIVEVDYNAKDINKFIFIADENMINKWYSIGEFEVVEPLGNEYVEVIASQKPFTSLPKTERIEKFGETFYMLLGRASQNIRDLSKTRAIKKVNERVAKLSYQTTK
jgi:hypothetical protein